MGKKVIPFPRKNQEQYHLKASGENPRTQLAEYFKEEVRRVETMALLLKVAETMCREEAQEDKNKKHE